MDSYMGPGAYPKWGTHTVKVTLQWDTYKAEHCYRVSGNCQGFGVMEDAPDSIVDALWPDIDEDEPLILTLRNPAGDEVAIELEDAYDIRNYIVAVEIVGFVEEAEEKV